MPRSDARDVSGARERTIDGAVLASRTESRAAARRAIAVVAAFVAGVLVPPLAAPAWAQRGPIDGHVSLTTDYLPNVSDTIELRARVFVERDVDATPNLRFSFSGWAEGFLARRPDADAVGSIGDVGLPASNAPSAQRRTVRDAIARPHEAYVDLRAGPLDLRAGLANVAWGRLDEVQPSDVINPLDISRYLFEGRSAARLPVPLIRGRWFARETLAVEGIWAPLFRRTRVDFLDEETSPFNLLTPAELTTAVLASGALCVPGPPCPPLPLDITVERDEPARTFANSQGGARLNVTTGRVDWSVSAYRGFESLGVVTLEDDGFPAAAPPTVPAVVPIPLHFVETFPRFTMIASDMETVRGPWTIRGEVAAFTEDTFQSEDGIGATPGHSIEGGGSLERKTGDYRINGALLIARRVTNAWSDTDVSLVTGAQRSFSRDTRRLFLFGVWNMADATGFLRSIGAWSLRDNLWLEGSVGWFFGEGTDTLSRFGARDFAYLRIQAYF